jgi:mono/diheme cytochrome c family protein
MWRFLRKIFVIICFLPAWSTDSFSQEISFLPEDPSKGWTVFIGKGCINCHAIREEGGKIGPDLGRKVFNLSLFQIAGVMWNHSPMMDLKMREMNLPRPVLYREEMGDLIAFLYYLNYFDEPGDPDRGRKLFSEKSCIVCHSIEGKGGEKGQAFDRMKQYPFPVFIAQNMWNHGPRMIDTMRKLRIAIPTFEGREIIDLFAYIRSVSVIGGGRRVYASPGNAKRGKDLFISKGCNRCHSSGGRGPDLAKMELRYSVTQIAGLMWNHWPQMWEQMEEIGLSNPVFSGEEMADIIAYIYSIRYSGEPGDPVRGEKIFSSKGCIKCHTIAGEGGTVAPDLAVLEITRSPITAAQAMWNHASPMEAKMKEKDIPWPRFEGNEMADLLEFLRAANRSSDAR